MNYTDDHKKSWHRAHTNVSGTTVTISNTQPGKPYYVSVSAVGGAWRNSSAVHAAIPRQVGAITLTRAKGEVTISWTAPACCDTPTGYDVVMSYDHKRSWFRMATNASGVTFKATGNKIKDYRGYHAAVRAVGTHGTGPWRNSGRIAPIGPTAKPGNLLGYRGSDFMDLEWDAVPDAAGYEVEYRESSKHYRHSAGSATGTTYKITGISDRPIYYVFVRAYNADGDGPWERTILHQVWTPVAPSSVTVTRSGASMDVSWVQCVPNLNTYDYGCDGGSPITGFSVDVKKTADGDWGTVEQSLTTYTSGSAVSVTGLDASASYEVRVGVTNRVGAEWSATQGPYN